MSTNWAAELVAATDRAYWAAENGIPNDVPLLVSEAEMAAVYGESTMFRLTTGRELPRRFTRLTLMGRLVEVWPEGPHDGR